MLTRSIGLLALVTACADQATVLPPGLVGLEIGMSLEDAVKRRDTFVVQSPVRAFDPVERIALALEGDKVAGVRMFIPAPADKAIQEYYATHFKSDQTSQYHYEIEGKNLKLYAVTGGVELLYGADPGSTAPEDQAKLQTDKKKKTDRGIGFLSPGPSMTKPKYFPVARSSEGIQVWLYPIGEPTNGPTNLNIFINTGSGDEIPDERGVTAVAAELLAIEISALARDRSVDTDTIVFRSGILFSFDGFTEDVQALGVRFAQGLQSLPTKKFSSEEITRAFQSSLRNTLDTNFDSRILSDEAFGSAFPETRFAHAPVDRKYSKPSSSVLVERIKAIRQSSLRILAAGSIGPKFAGPIVEALGSRISTPFSPLPETDKAKRSIRKVLSPMLALDGLMTKTSSLAQVAQLFVAREYLLSKLEKSSLFSQGLNIGKPSVIVGGQMGKRFVMSFATASGQDAKRATAAIDQFLNTSVQEELDEEEFLNVRQAAISAFSSVWNTPNSATDMMLKLSLMGLSIEDVNPVWGELDKVKNADLKDLIRAYQSPEQRFSVRWGPEL